MWKEERAHSLRPCGSLKGDDNEWEKDDELATVGFFCHTIRHGTAGLKVIVLFFVTILTTAICLTASF